MNTLIISINHYFYIPFLIFLFSCSISSESIDYGNDGCHFCTMTIVDKIHGAEIVTEKGKIYKFDAAECMINFLNSSESPKIALYLTNHYTKPIVLVDATKSTYLISKNISSPMGAFLTAFENKIDAEKIQSEKGGTIFTWEEVLLHFKNQNK